MPYPCLSDSQSEQRGALNHVYFNIWSRLTWGQQMHPRTHFRGAVLCVANDLVFQSSAAFISCQRSCTLLSVPLLRWSVHSTARLFFTSMCLYPLGFNTSCTPLCLSHFFLLRYLIMCFLEYIGPTATDQLKYFMYLIILPMSLLD